MQTVDCNVALGGDVRMVVRKRDVTIAELVVLQQVHGREHVTDVVVTGEAVNFDTVAERDRLARFYELTEQSPRIGELFPGVKPQMPTKLSDVELVATEDDQGGKSGELQVRRFDGATPPTDEGDEDGEDFEDEDDAAEDEADEDEADEADEADEDGDAPPGAEPPAEHVDLLS